MPTPFALLEQRANAAVLAHLSDAEGWVGARPAQGLFDESWDLTSSQGLQQGGSRPTWTVADAALPEDWEHVPVRITQGIGQGIYRIVEAHPMQAGLVTLVLERELS